MSARWNGLTITFSESIKDEDGELIINAIKMIKGVIDVTPNVNNFEQTILKKQLKHEFLMKMVDLFE